MKNINYNCSKPEYEIIIAKDVLVTMRDNINLSTDIYFPSKNCTRIQGKYPVLLQRTIYDKSRKSFTENAEFFCKRGYISIIQDVRGRYQSEGEYYHFINEPNDGYDTLKWINTQNWSNGKVGTFGVSYGSQVQSALATQNPKNLSAMIPMEGPANIYKYGLRHDGAFQLKFLTAAFWSGITSQEADNNKIIKKILEKARMSQWLNRLPLKKGNSPLSHIPNYERWIFDFMERENYDEFWENPGFNIEAHYKNHADVPIYLIGGWYDSWSRAMFDMFTDLSKIKKGPIKILMGPWVHGENAVSWTYAGNIDLGKSSSLDNNIAENHNSWRLKWFDRWLKNINNDVENDAPIKIFVMGGGSGKKNKEDRLEHGGKWRDEYEWPLKRTKFTNYYFHPDGVLSTENPNKQNSYTKYVYNPKKPVPTISGNLSALAEIIPMPEGVEGEPPPMTRLKNLNIQGGANQVEYEGGFGCVPPFLPLSSRQDVLVFQTQPLEKEIELTGPIKVKLWLSSNQVDTDITAKLLDIYPESDYYIDGYHLNISDGIIRAKFRDFTGKANLLERNKIYEFTIFLDPTSNVFMPGHKIRVDISSSNFPRFDINPNTGCQSSGQQDYLLATNTLYHNKIYPSHIILPVI